MQEQDQHFLRISFKVAQHAREHGNHPFGALLVDANGKALLSAENSVVTQKDVTGHAELNLIRAASKSYSAEELKHCTVYASGEPCPMCAAAIVWCNVRRVVFGLGMQGIYDMFEDVPDAPGLKMHATDVLSTAPWPIEVIGPALEDEARLPHQGFW